MLRVSLCLLSLILLFSCTPDNKVYQDVLTKDLVPTTLLDIDNTHDTTIQTGLGTRIYIPQGAFSKERVRLTVKEAYSLDVMVKAGLVTQTNGKPLRSGGMIYIDAVDQDVSIRKDIGVSVPAEEFDPQMKLYKGEDKGGKINWTDPQPLANPDQAMIDAGKILFQQNCATCHATTKPLTGPALINVQYRGPWTNRQDLYAFIHNPPQYIADHGGYVKCLQEEYKALMTPFPALTNQSIDAMISYLESERVKQGIAKPSDREIRCADSCRRYDSVRHLLNGRSETESSRVLLDYGNNKLTQTPVSGTVDTASDQLPPSDKVEVADYRTQRYQFTINVFGWHNIDALLDDGTMARLTVQVSGEVNVFLVVPQQKVFVEGGRLSSGAGYGFDNKDGTIGLKRHTPITIFALSEKDEKLFFDIRELLSTGEDNISLTLHEVGKEQLLQTLSRFQAPAMKIDEAPKLKPGMSKDSVAELLERFRPKGCDCSPCMEGDVK